MDGQGPANERDGSGRIADSNHSVDRDVILAALRSRLPERATIPLLMNALVDTARSVIDVPADGDGSIEPLLLLSPQIGGQILRNLRDGVIIADRSGHIIAFNDAAESIFGCRRAGVLGSPLAALLPAQSWTMAPPRSPAPHASQPVRLVERAESVGQSPGGAAPFPIELTAVAADEVIVVTVTDLSERKRLEGESARHHQILKSVIDNMPGGVTVFGDDLEMIICNRRVRDMLEFPDELFSRGLPSFRTLLEFNARRGEYGDGDIDTVVGALLERARHPVPHVHERRRPDGVVLEIRGMPLPDGGFVTIYIDITDRKRAEEEAERNATYLRSVLDAMPGGVTVFGDDLEMIVCNRRARDMLEFPDELFSQGLPSFRTLLEFNARRGEYGDGDVDTVVAALLERARRPVPHVHERRRPDGTILEIRGRPLPEGGFVTIYIDITDRKRVEEEAKRYATYLRSVLEAMPQGISVFDEKLELVLWNQAFLKILDLPEALIKPGVPYLDIIRFNADRGEYDAKDLDEYVEWRARMALRFEPHWFERVRPNGQALDVQGRPIYQGSAMAGFVTTYADVTQSKKADEMIRRANELMEDAIGFSPTYVWEVDRDGRFTFLKGTQKVLGYDSNELLGRRFTDLQCGAPQCREHAAMLDMAFDDRAPFEHALSCARHKNGAHIWISISAHPIFDRHGAFIGYRGVNVDVTEVTRVRQDLERMALHDPLTGLANRRKFMDRFKLEAARQARHGQPLALLVADIDHFKSVNDKFGHLTGDMCLKCVADVLSMAVRQIDLVARFGGEEFLVLLPETNPEGAIIIAEKLRQSVESLNIPIETRFEPLNITISIGVACMPADHQVSFDTLMEIADQGLYGAKQAGRNRVLMFRRIGDS